MSTSPKYHSKSVKKTHNFLKLSIVHVFPLLFLNFKYILVPLPGKKELGSIQTA